MKNNQMECDSKGSWEDQLRISENIIPVYNERRKSSKRGVLILKRLVKKVELGSDLIGNKFKIISASCGSAIVKAKEFNTFLTKDSFKLAGRPFQLKELKSLSENNYLDVLLALLPPGYIGHDSRKVNLLNRVCSYIKDLESYMKILQDIQSEKFVYLDERDIAQEIEYNGSIKEDVHSILLKNHHGDQQMLQANSEDHDHHQSPHIFDGNLSYTRKQTEKKPDSAGFRLCPDVCKIYSKNERLSQRNQLLSFEDLTKPYRENTNEYAESLGNQRLFSKHSYIDDEISSQVFTNEEWIDNEICTDSAFDTDEMLNETGITMNDISTNILYEDVNLNTLSILKTTPEAQMLSSQYVAESLSPITWRTSSYGNHSLERYGEVVKQKFHL